MAKPIIKYVSLRHGCKLSCDTPDQILRSEGSNNVEYVRNATSEEVAWIKAMGGNVPDGRIAEPA